ncbi:MAG TPA: hypothetical protein VE074_02185 [Jatrophihabitantaceae bacterium]|nr:hypothetical protein [Jatrophihabitantaceae bacterium]
MAILRRLVGGSRQEPATIVFDNTLGNARVQRVVGHVRAGDWRSIHDECEQLDDPTERLFVAHTLGKLDRFPDDWLPATIGSQFPLLARGSFLTEQAFRIRGGARASEVEQSAWQPFFESLNQARDYLLHASELAPADPGPWAKLLTVGMALDSPKDTILEWFEAATSRVPGFYPAYWWVVAPLSKRWGGSHDLMFDVARTANAELPDGGSGRVALAAAHTERWKYYLYFEDNDDAATDYYVWPEVSQEIEAAAQNSAFSPHRDQHVLTRHLLGEFALPLALSGRVNRPHYGLATKLFDELGDIGVHEIPWTLRWPDNGAEWYVRIRNLCRKAAR